jgi:hypothetical protein
MSSTTRAALLRYQRAANLAESGVLDEATARSMGLAGESLERTVPVSVTSFESRIGPDGRVDVALAATTNTGGWDVAETHFVTADTLHVYVRGAGPSGPATQALTRHDLQFTLGADEARGVTRYVVHGAGADLTGDLGAAAGPDIGDLSRRVSAMLRGYERALGVRTLRSGAVTLTGRGYTEPEMELYFAINSLASSLALHTSVAPSVSDPASLHGAVQVIVRAARQVDRAVGRAGTNRTTGVERDWSAMRSDFADLAASINASLDRDER